MVNEERATYVICLYLCKAFDTVQHNLFISKLERHGSDRSMDKELAEGCTQRAVVSDPVSEWRAVTSGISQGLVIWTGAV